MKTASLSAIVLILQLAWLGAPARASAQPSPEPSRAAVESDAPPPTDLFARASTTDLVVLAAVTEVKPIGRRLREEDRKNVTNLAALLGGYLYTLRVESVLSARQDFAAGSTRPALAGKDVYVFKPRDSAFFSGGDLSAGARYVVFLNAVADSEKLAAEYLLPTGVVAFQTPAGDAGRIAVEGDGSAVLARWKAFGAALEPSSADEKVVRLNRLLPTSDAELERSLQAAIDRVVIEVLGSSRPSKASPSSGP